MSSFSLHPVKVTPATGASCFVLLEPYPCSLFCSCLLSLLYICTVSVWLIITSLCPRLLLVHSHCWNHLHPNLLHSYTDTAWFVLRGKSHVTKLIVVWRERQLEPLRRTSINAAAALVTAISINRTSYRSLRYRYRMELYDRM